MCYRSQRKRQVFKSSACFPREHVHLGVLTPYRVIEMLFSCPMHHFENPEKWIDYLNRITRTYNANRHDYILVPEFTINRNYNNLQYKSFLSKNDLLVQLNLTELDGESNLLFVPVNNETDSIIEVCDNTHTVILLTSLYMGCNQYELTFTVLEIV